MLQGLAGNAKAYQAFLQRLAGHLRAFFRRRLLQCPQDVEDLVQETLLAVHNQRHTYEPDQPLTAWVHAIARYKLIDLLRSRATHEALHEPLDEASGLFAESDANAYETHHDLRKLLDMLPDKQRIPIIAVKLQGRSVSDVASRTGMSESAVKVGIHRGLKKLAACFREGKTS
jgi:RNA polymerase sigma-70 factor (ECF subfamily)